MLTKRTDLAVEAHELWSEESEQTTELPGVKASEYSREGYGVTKVEILDDRGADALGKPRGTYVTVELDAPADSVGNAFNRAVASISSELSPMLKLSGAEDVLVAGLGNRGITPDAIGPKTVSFTMVTRHLVQRMPEHFGNLREVSAITPGVLGTTGLESVEIIKGVVERSKPACVIIIDALASRKLSRLCSTVQLADTGIVPGSGVGNSRAAINHDTLGVPVIAIGVPTVVDAATLAADLLESAGIAELDPASLSPYGGSLIVTTKDIDSKVDEIAKIVGYSINMALQNGLAVDDISAYLS